MKGHADTSAPFAVCLAQDRLTVRADFAHKDACKAIPGARWDPHHKVWTYPRSPASAQHIAAVFGSRARWDAAATALLDAARAGEAAQHHKTAETVLPIPLTKTVPWAHQCRAYHFAAALPACMLSLDMGTGKSKIAIDLIGNQRWQRVLILCPKSVVPVWPMEIEKHAASPLPCLPLETGAIQKRTDQLSVFLRAQAAKREPAAVVLNYDAAWRRPLADAILDTAWDAVVCDESHRIKSPGGRASLFCARLGAVAQRRLCLTGTPLPHSPLDAYGQFRFLDPGIFGTSFTNFRARYAIMGGYGQHQVIGWQHREDFHERFYSIAYRVRSEDVLTLPETLDTVIPVTLSASAKATYDQLEKDFVAEVGDGQITASNALTRLLRLQQMTSGWAKPDAEDTESQPVQIDTAKQEALADLMAGVKEDEPLVVFCRFHHDLDAVRTAADALGRACAELSGRRNDLAAWQAGTMPILAVQIQSGGVGVNLTRARYCVFYSLGFSLGEYLQARKRVHRPGQAHPVVYYHLIATKTVDAQVYRALEARQDVVETILQQTTRESWPPQPPI